MAAEALTSYSKTLKAVPVRRRSAARLAAIQITYQSMITGRSSLAFAPDFLAHYTQELLTSFKIKDLDHAHLSALYTGVESGLEALDDTISSALSDGWVIDRLARIELAVLRCGVFELISMPNIPVKAVVSEYAALADVCGAEVGFVNAVLDRLGRQSQNIGLN